MKRQISLIIPRIVILSVDYTFKILKYKQWYVYVYKLTAMYSLGALTSIWRILIIVYPGRFKWSLREIFIIFDLILHDNFRMHCILIDHSYIVPFNILLSQITYITYNLFHVIYTHMTLLPQTSEHLLTYLFNYGLYYFFFFAWFIYICLMSGSCFGLVCITHNPFLGFSIWSCLRIWNPFLIVTL